MTLHYPTPEQLAKLEEVQQELAIGVPEYEAVWNPNTGKINVIPKKPLEERLCTDCPRSRCPDCPVTFMSQAA